MNDTNNRKPIHANPEHEKIFRDLVLKEKYEVVYLTALGLLNVIDQSGGAVGNGDKSFDDAVKMLRFAVKQAANDNFSVA